MPILTADDVGGKHRYIAENRPDWRMSVSQIKNLGGPWGPCEVCDSVSYLVYRCSVCGAEL